MPEKIRFNDSPLTSVILTASMPFQPSQFTLGIAEELRDLASRIESGALTVTKFSFTMENDPYGQKLELEVQ